MENKISCCVFFILFAFCLSTYAEDYALKNPESGQDIMCPGGQHVIGLHETCSRTTCVTDSLHCG